MKIVIFGLTISSSWGNGHATLWRGLCKALARLGHDVVFFERDVAYYAQTRDWLTLPYGDLVFYSHWDDVCARAARELADADAAIVTSYCADALSARALMLDAPRPLAVFYDLDTPVTLARLEQGETVPYVGAEGLRDFDLVLSYTGGAALDLLHDVLGARRVRALYGHVDPDVHRPVPAQERYAADLSWLGTFAVDRQLALEELFVRPARLCPQLKFRVAGAQYPHDFPWSENVYFDRHLPPHEHAAFLCSSRLTLNVTRAEMARLGFCPSGRLFEAAACGVPILSDVWSGLDEFYRPHAEILVARDAQDTLAALANDDSLLRAVAAAARERTLDEHTSMHRAADLVAMLEDTAAARPDVQREQPSAAQPGYGACGA
jgi:spore maturation protein CgeB